MFSVVLVVLLCAVAVAAQSLGEVARESRKNKSAQQRARVYTEDDVRTATEQVAAEAETSPATTAEPAPAARPQTVDEARTAVAEQKKKVIRLEHELNSLRRENRVREASHQSDQGTRVSEEVAKQFPTMPLRVDYGEQERAYRAARERIEAKEKELEAARAVLRRLEEDLAAAQRSRN